MHRFSVFQFGGKLICVENPKPSHGQAVPPVVTISQVVTEMDLVERSKLLEATIAADQYLVFCDSKVLTSQDKAERELWSFLKVWTSYSFSLSTIILFLRFFKTWHYWSY